MYPVWVDWSLAKFGKFPAIIFLSIFSVHLLPLLVSSEANVKPFVRILHVLEAQLILSFSLFSLCCSDRLISVVLSSSLLTLPLSSSICCWVHPLNLFFVTVLLRSKICFFWFNVRMVYFFILFQVYFIAAIFCWPLGHLFQIILSSVSSRSHGDFPGSWCDWFWDWILGHSGCSVMRLWILLEYSVSNNPTPLGEGWVWLVTSKVKAESQFLAWPGWRGTCYCWRWGGGQADKQRCPITVPSVASRISWKGEPVYTGKW